MKEAKSYLLYQLLLEERYQWTHPWYINMYLEGRQLHQYRQSKGTNENPRTRLKLQPV